MNIEQPVPVQKRVRDFSVELKIYMLRMMYVYLLHLKGKLNM